MSIQAQLNKAALELVPVVNEHIKKSGAFESNQMINVVLREAMNSDVSLDSMSTEQLEKFQESLIERFKNNNWI